MRKGSVRWWGVLGCTAIFAPIASGSAQQLVSANPVTMRSEYTLAQRAESVRTADPLDRPVSVTLRNVTVRDAVRAVGKAANVTVTHSNELDKSRGRVSLKAEGMPLGDALSRVLAETNLTPVVIAPTEVLIKAPSMAADSVGTLRITVVDSGAKEGLGGVMVTVNPGNRRVLTESNGTATLTNLPAGRYTISARRMGFSPAERTVQLAAGGNVEVSLPVGTMASVLSEVVTTGSGERSRQEVGYSISTLNADSVQATTPVSNISQLLASRFPGLVAVSGGGAVGAPTRLRIRGNSSIEGDNSPVIIIDGIRVSNDVTTEQANTIFSGVMVSGAAGQNSLSQRLDDLDPNSVESIEVLKGPAASTLYGSEAANGVIVIKTKRGRAGPTRWTVRLNHRELVQSKDYAYAVGQVGSALTGSSLLIPTCTTATIANGSCIPSGETAGFNMLEDDRFTPIGRGYSQDFGADVSGGTEKMQFFLGGTYRNELGNFKLPNVNAVWITQGRGGNKLNENILRPNALHNASADAKMSGNMTDWSDFVIAARFITNYQRSGNQGASALLSALRDPSDTTPVDGWTYWNGTRSQDSKNIQGSAVVNVLPEWRGNRLTGSITYGWNYTFTDDLWYVPRGSCKPLCTSTTDPGVLGYVNAGRKSDFVQTLNLIGGAVSQPTYWLKTDIRTGIDFQKSNKWNLYGNTSDLRLGQKFYSSNGAKQIQDVGDARGTAGWFVEPLVSIRERLFMSVGLRGDVGSSLGDQVAPKYPKYNMSWVASDEPFFPQVNFLDVLRFRFAYGKAGKMPTTNARIRTYSASTGFVTDTDPVGSGSGGYAQLTGPGNLWIRPELSRELEGGFDIEMFQGRIVTDFSLFSKNTKDAIWTAPLAGSVGAYTTYNNKLNVGTVTNKGYELSVTARVVDRPMFYYSVNANIASAKNKLAHLNPGVISHTLLNSSGDVYTGNVTRVVEGYPMYSRWAYPILGYEDVNGNGYIDPLEVRVGDSLVYVGDPQPKYEMNVNHSFSLFQNRVSVYANFNYIRGLVQHNAFAKQYMASLPAARGIGSLADQACLVAATAQGQRRATDWCFMENTNTLRFNNLAISFALSPRLAQKLRAAGGSFAFTANNLAIWSNFKGRDPTMTTTPTSLNSVEAGSAFAPPKQIGASLRLTY